MLANSTAVRAPLQAKLARYRKMFARKAFLHYYVDLGLAVERMEEAEAALLDVVAQYQSIHDSVGATMNDAF